MFLPLGVKSHMNRLTHTRNSAVSDCFAPDDVIRHAGLVMAQAMNIASVLNVDELICPFAVVTKGDSRESIEFESTTQDEAISEGWANLEKYKEFSTGRLPARG